MLELFVLSCIFSLVQAGEKYGTVIGIDLGTTYSVVAVYQNKNVYVIPNDQGNRITPSYISYEPDGTTLVGDAAKNQLSIRPQSTLYELKRLIGRDSSDTSFHIDLKTWPFKVLLDGPKPMVSVKVGDDEKVISPAMGSALILMKMKNIAELQLNQTITHAVITVPAYFNDAQRQATKDAGAIAGLNVLRVINEPTAAALAFGMDKQMTDSKVIVFDLGGGTFDVSILTIDNGVFEVMSTCGDTHLGGQDFDRALTLHIIKKMASEGIDVGTDQKIIQRIREAAERAKRDLSSKLETSLQFEYDGIRKSYKVTRAEFERLIDDYLKKVIPHVEKCLKDANLKKTEIDHVLLVGGSTRIPKVSSMVTNFFNKKPSLGVNPDEAVAAGAAIQGSILSGSEDVSDVVLLDNVPLALGIETVGGVMAVVVPRGTTIPNKKSQVFSTAADNQESVQIKVYEGERGVVEGNRLLNSFTLTGIRPAPKGVPQIEVTFEVDADSILTVHAEDKDTGVKSHVVVNDERSKMSREEIQRMLDEAEKYKAQDEKLKKDIESRNEFENKVYHLNRSISDKEKKQFDDSVVAKLNLVIQEAIKWLDDNKKPDYEVTKVKIEEFDEKVRAITGASQGQQPKEEEL